MEKRNYGIDFLRILSMYMAVILHVLGRGGILSAAEPFGVSYYAAWFVEIAAYCAVDCFALISGYVMCGSNVKLSRVAELWLQTAFYTVSITALLFIFRPALIGKNEILDAVFPVTRGHYWYISAYFGLYILIPVLNAAINNVERRVLKTVFVAGFVMFTVLPTFLLSSPYALGGGYSVIWLALLYLVGGYIKKHGVAESFKSYKGFILYAVMIILTFLFKLTAEKLTVSDFSLSKYGNLLVSYCSPTIVLAGVFLFLSCASMRVCRVAQRVISVLAPATLGVYLIHVSKPVWTHVLPGFSKDFLSGGTGKMIVLVFASGAAIYILCTAIELIRILLFRLLRIKKICLSVENIILKKIKKTEFI